jgi:hypothetical protein
MGFARAGRHLHTTLSLAVVTLMLCTGAAAGQSTQDASIIGQVTDQEKGVLPGVTVTATSPALQLPQLVVVTDDRGEYRLTPLPIGTYTVEYSLGGFQTVRREGVRLTAGFTARLDIVLGVGTLQETVTVSGVTPLVDVAATNTSTQLTRERLDAIPTIRESLTGVLQLVPGTRPGLVASGSSFQNFNTNAFGRAAQPWQSIDGVVTVNPRASQSGNMFDFTSFEEATVSTLGHDASVPNSGPNITTVIKSGSNTFHGGAFYAGTSSNFEAESLLAGSSKTTIKDEVSGEIGGKIVRDKLWFWAGGRRVRDHKELVDAPVCVKSDGSPCDNVANQQYLTVKPTFQLNAAHRLSGFFYVGRGRNRAVSNLGSWDSRRDHNFRPSAGKAEWQWVRGQSLVLTTNVGAWSAMSGSVCPDDPDRTLRRNIDDNDVNRCTGVATTDTVTRVVTGLDPRSGERTQEGRVQARTSASYYKPDWFLGNHELKAGFEVFHAPQNRINIGRGPAGNYQLTFQNTTPNQITFWNYPIHPKLNLRYYSTYVADSWTIGRKLTLNLGVRHAYDQAYELATCRVTADYPSATIYPAECFDDVRLPPYNTFVPRLRAAYDVSGDGKNVVKGGWGRYVVMRTSDMVDIAAKHTGASSTYRWRDLDGDRDYDVGETNLDPNGSDFLSRLGAAQIASALQGGIVNPDEKAPYEDEYSIQYERQLSNVLALRVTGVHTRTGNEIRVANPLRPYDVYNIPIANPDPGPDGTVGTADDTGTTITYFDYSAAYAGLAFQRPMYVNDPRANKHFSTMEFSVSKRLADRWQFQTSYTATKVDVPFVNNAGGFNTQDPNAEIFAADRTWEWQYRASGSYRLPYDVQLSGNFEHRSGIPWARTAQVRGGVRIPNITVRVEPIGTQRLPNINMLHMRAEKRFELPRDQSVAAGMNIFNALNTQVATAVTAQSGSNFGVVTSRIFPRNIEFQVQYRF